jgi:hypothetical protein
MTRSAALLLTLFGCGPVVVQEPAPPAPARVKLLVNFTTLEVVDDKESGSGDWRVAITVNGKPLGDLVTGEADAGEAVDIGRTVTSEGLEASHKLVVTAKVEEWDGGFDMTMEFIGEDTRTYDAENAFGVGGQIMEFDAEEGHVKLRYSIVRESE